MILDESTSTPEGRQGSPATESGPDVREPGLFSGLSYFEATPAHRRWAGNEPEAKIKKNATEAIV